MILLQRARLGMEWEQRIVKEMPEYFLTITFAYPFADSVCEEAMRFFVKALIRKLPRKKQSTAHGFICAERVVKKVKFEGTYHFHFLLCGFDSIFSDAGDWLSRSVRDVAARIRSRTGVPMVLPHNLKLQRIKDGTGREMAGYCTKDIYRIERPAGCQILVVRGGQVIDRLQLEEGTR